MSRSKREAVCVIGAGSSGLAAVRELSQRGLPVECFERGSRVGGNWRYENDNGYSAAYASLRTNVSRQRMQYPSFPMSDSYGEFPTHAQMATYLEAYAESFDLMRQIRFKTCVARIEPERDGRWRVRLDDGSERRYRAVVVANGHDWKPSWPRFSGETAIEIGHAHDYRVPEPYAGLRVLVIGAGQSGCEIACEISAVASRTWLSARRGVHVLPRHVLGAPYDYGDRAPFNLVPWPVLRALFARLAALSRGGRPADFGLAEPAHRFLEQLPAVSDDIVPALRRGAVEAMPGVDRVEGGTVLFADDRFEEVDRIICATGYRIDFPFLPDGLIDLDPERGAVRLYRRIVPPRVANLFFVGLADAPGGLLPLVEAQSAWLADVLSSRIELPDSARMEAAIDRGEGRSRLRFPDELPYSVRFDPHAHRRMLARDRLWASLSGAVPRLSCPDSLLRLRRPLTRS